MSAGTRHKELWGNTFSCKYPSGSRCVCGIFLILYFSSLQIVPIGWFQQKLCEFHVRSFWHHNLQLLLLCCDCVILLLQDVRSIHKRHLLLKMECHRLKMKRVQLEIKKLQRDVNWKWHKCTFFGGILVSLSWLRRISRKRNQLSPSLLSKGSKQGLQKLCTKGLNENKCLDTHLACLPSAASRTTGSTYPKGPPFLMGAIVPCAKKRCYERLPRHHKYRRPCLEHPHTF